MPIQTVKACIPLREMILQRVYLIITYVFTGYVITIFQLRVKNKSFENWHDFMSGEYLLKLLSKRSCYSFEAMNERAKVP